MRVHRRRRRRVLFFGRPTLALPSRAIDGKQIARCFVPPLCSRFLSRRAGTDKRRPGWRGICWYGGNHRPVTRNQKSSRQSQIVIKATGVKERKGNELIETVPCCLFRRRATRFTLPVTLVQIIRVQAKKIVFEPRKETDGKNYGSFTAARQNEHKSRKPRLAL